MGWLAGRGGAARIIGIPGLINKIDPKNNSDCTIDLIQRNLNINTPLSRLIPDSL